jgi:hypothetical protein
MLDTKVGSNTAVDIAAVQGSAAAAASCVSIPTRSSASAAHIPLDCLFRTRKTRAVGVGWEKVRQQMQMQSPLDITPLSWLSPLLS